MQHDSGYHLLFSHPELVEDLFKSFVTEPWVAQLDFTTLQRVNAKLHAEGLERRDGDLIYKVLYRDGSEVYLYLLLEFQSQPDPWMALRVLVYVGLLYQQLIRENRVTHGKLPPVFPLVLYNGDSRWNAAQNLKDLIALPSATPLWSYQPSIRYYLVDESRYPEGKPGSIVGLLFEVENCRSREQLQPVIDTLMEHGKALPRSLRRALGTWIYRVIAPGKNIDPQGIDLENFAEVQIMLATRMKQWEQELVEKGREEGIERGIEKGREEGIEKGIEKGVLTGEAVILRRQLKLRFGPLPAWADAKIAQAQRAELEQWSERVLDATSLDAVFM